MNALQILEPGTAVYRGVPDPKPNPGEVLVKVQGVTTCPHWDLHIMDGQPMFENHRLEYPYHVGQPGHEMTGIIAGLGENTSGFSVGDRVAVWRDSGPYRQGAYAEFVCLPAENVLPVPEDLSLQQIASLELAMCVQVSIDRLGSSDLLKDKTVGVNGLGPSGLIAVQMARAAGARRVLGFDPVTERRELGMLVGADACLIPGQFYGPTPSDGMDLDAAVDTTGLREPIQEMVRRSRKAVVLFGVLRDFIGFGPEHWWGGFSLLGYGEHNVGAAGRALDQILSGTLDLSVLVSETMSLRSYSSGVEMLRQREAIKVLFVPE